MTNIKETMNIILDVRKILENIKTPDGFNDIALNKACLELGLAIQDLQLAIYEWDRQVDALSIVGIKEKLNK